MTALRAFLYGLCGGGRTLAQAALFYLASFLLGSFAAIPFAGALHAVLDGSPVASELSRGEGLDLLGELGANQPGIFDSSFAQLPAYALVCAALALLLLGGAYAAARDEEAPLREAFPAGAGRGFLPFLAVVLLNTLPLLAYGVFVALVGAGLFGLAGETADPGPGWWAFLGTAGLAVFLLHHLRTSIGYGQALLTLRGEGRGLLRCAWDGFLFTWRRFLPVVGMTWVLNLLRVFALAVPFLLGPGYSTTGRWLASVALWQVAFFALAYLRVAEVRMQVEYASEMDRPA